MFANMSLRWKLLAIVLIPVLLLAATSGYLVVRATNAAHQAHIIDELSHTSATYTAFVHAMQDERSATADYITQPSPANKAALNAARQRLDSQMAWLHQQMGPSSPMRKVSPQASQGMAMMAKMFGQLGQIRSAVDHGAKSPKLVGYYDQLIGMALMMPEATAQSTTNLTLQHQLRTYGASMQIAETAAQERDLVNGALASNGFTKATFGAFVAQRRLHLGWEGVYQLNATPSENKLLSQVLALPASKAVNNMRFAALSWPVTHTVGINPAQWETASNARLNAIYGLQTPVVNQLMAAASSQYHAAQRTQRIVLASALGGILAAMVLTFFLMRRILDPVQELTETAKEVSEELPRMVERVQEPGADPELEIAPLPVNGSDEIGRLAEAFNNVNTVTVRIAREQAVLRGQIAEMFVNVARRNQSLLSRQLTFIDELEQSEEDPDSLESLFRLDHLATRMRRNAESLLVLAGIDSTRRLRKPAPLTDVIRIAVSEIESFDRIDLVAEADPAISGRVALNLAHLVAELLENATNFSSPESRVQVITRWHRDGGALVSVVDAGLGMTEEEMEKANERLAHPAVGDAVLTERLGFLVVARLAKRLGIRVALALNPVGGTIAHILIGQSILERDTVQAATPDHSAEAPVALAPATVPAAAAPAAPEAQSAEPARRERWAAPVLNGSALPTRSPQPEAAGDAPAPLATRKASQPAEPLPARTAAPEAPAQPLAGSVPSAVFGEEEPEYRPTFVAERSALAKRPERSEEQAEAQPVEDLGPAVHRTPGEVRGMLSAFRSGVERGRNRPGGISDIDEEEL